MRPRPRSRFAPSTDLATVAATIMGRSGDPRSGARRSCSVIYLEPDLDRCAAG